MKPNLVLLTDSDDADLRDQIQQIAPDCEIVAPKDDQALERAGIIYGGVKPDAIEGAKNLRWLQLQSAGVNRWDLRALDARGVQITNVSGIHAQPITEHMFGMLLLKTRALDEALRVQSEHQWSGHDFLVQLIAGKTLGLLGVGAIGSHAASVGKAFGMRVLGLRHSGKSEENVEQMFTPDNRLDFFAQSDVIMNTLPLTDDTHGFMGAAEFDALPAGAIVINAGRGETIDTGALMAWLQSDAANRACLDVTNPEPLPPDHPLWELKNVFITPHYSGSFPDYMKRANAIFLDNLKRFVGGQTLHNLVDAKAGY